MRLFLAHGYAATTVSQVAEAAEVSSMTVFRYFPTKEDLVLADEFDPLIAERLRQQPAGEPVLRRIAGALVAGIGELTAQDRELLLARVKLVMGTPALRARQWESQYATQRVIVEALLDEMATDETGGDQAGEHQRGDEARDGSAFHLQVCAGACLAAASAAITRWSEQDGSPDLRQLMEQALGMLGNGANR